MAPADVGLGVVLGLRRLLALAHLGLVEPRAQHRPRPVARFLCCERSLWHCTTMLVGRCVMRTALSVLLTCWPPAPDAR